MCVHDMDHLDYHNVWVLSSVDTVIYIITFLQVSSLPTFLPVRWRHVSMTSRLVIIITTPVRQFTWKKRAWSGRDEGRRMRDEGRGEETREGGISHDEPVTAAFIIRKHSNSVWTEDEGVCPVSKDVRCRRDVLNRHHVFDNMKKIISPPVTSADWGDHPETERPINHHNKLRD